MRNRMTFLLGISILSVLGLGYMVFSGGGESASAARFETASVERGDIERVVAATGSVRPLVTVELGSELSGQIAELSADFNDEVAANAVVALIDPRTFAARVEQAEADLKLAQAGLISAEAAMIRAQANLAKAERDFERNSQLAAKGNLSESALDEASTALEVARADLMSARAQQTTAEATVDQRRAALEQARIDLDRTEIRSPIDGVIVNRAVDVGQTVAASLSAPILFEIAQDLRSIQIEASVDEADIGGVKAGDPVRFTVDAYPERRFSGTVRQVRLAPIELQNVVTYTVVIAAENPDRSLLPGMTANLEIITGSRQNVLRVPNEALRFRPPDAIAAAAAEQRNRAGGAGPGGFSDLADRLGLSDEQRAAVRGAMAELRRGMGQGGAGGGLGGSGSGDPAAQRARMQARLERMFEGILTEEQMQRYRAFREGGAQSRTVTVWLKDESGALTPRRVRIGIGDNRYSEVISGLEAGEAVVTREALQGGV